MTRVVICAGLGGVGKTTIAAALALGAAGAGERVVVLTIDPARRLADALGVGELGNTPVRVPLNDVPAPGGLDALMLDRKATFDEVVTRFAPNADAARRLLDNPYYRAVSTRLTGSHEYMASEKLFDLVDSGRWDVVVVDTPPAQHALDFLRAPERLQGVFDRRVVSVIADPGRGLLSVAGRGVTRILENLAGEHVFRDIAEFFSLLGALSAGFRERSRAVHDLLHSDRARYVLVTSAAAPDRADVLAFLGALRERNLQFDGFVVNRAVWAPALLPEDLALPPPPEGIAAEDWDALRHALAARLVHRRRAAAHQVEAVRALSRAAGGAPSWTVPDLAEGVRSLDGLREIARHLPPAVPPTP